MQLFFRTVGDRLRFEFEFSDSIENLSVRYDDLFLVAARDFAIRITVLLLFYLFDHQNLTPTSHVTNYRAKCTPRARDTPQSKCMRDLSPFVPTLLNQIEAKVCT